MIINNYLSKKSALVIFFKIENIIKIYRNILGNNFENVFSLGKINKLKKYTLFTPCMRI